MLLKIQFYLILSIIFIDKLCIVEQHFVSETEGVGVADFVNVQTSSGPVRGRTARTLFTNKSYFAFAGIPYGIPPVKELRFKPPVPMPPWHDVRDCFHFGSPCLQKNVSNPTVEGNEDCLFLNVFTPAIEKNRLRSVMLYIHGGAWYVGYGQLFPPDFLIHEDVIVVTINYRLGAMGFMSLGTPEYSGNQGLKDQQLAMKWVYANIAEFGGDRNSITLFGDSSGTMSSIIHMFAPESKGLYQRSIEISSTFDIWSIVAKPHHHDDMLRFAQRQNSSVQTTADLIEHLLKVEPTDYVKHFPFKFYHNIIMPTVEMDNALQPLALITPSDLVLEGPLQNDIDVLTGFTSGEALFLARFSPQHDFVDNLRIQLPSIHFDSGMYDTAEYRLAAHKICDFYFPNASEYTKHNLERLKSDVYQRYFIDRRVKMLAEKSTGRTYYYRFAMETVLNYFKVLLGADSGASHGDDLCYVSPCNFSVRSLKAYEGLTVDSREYGMIRTMSKLYANFAKYGNPAPSLAGFGPVRPNRYTFLDISNDGLTVGEDPLMESSRFWDQLMAEHPSLLNLWR